MENQNYPQIQHLVELMTFALLASNAFELSHIGGGDWRPIEGQMVNLCHFTSRLIVFDKQLNVLHILELYELEWDRGAAFQIIWR